MPDILFDGHKVRVPPGTNLVEAGLEAKIQVPVFCYHKDLGAVGSCRVCALTITKDGKSRTVMGCMTAAEDGMEVTTLDPTSVGIRKYVLEWLMTNHPHDCPICDEGGECQLQDLTIAAGHGIRRYHERKRTFRNQHLGEFIVHEMNRCIACYRCSRFYQEFAGGRDFGVTGSRNRVYFGRFEDGPLESPFSGNLVEMCPTGVFTDKLFRYRSRVWDLEVAPSICPHCSVGCNVRPGARHRELQRVRVRENPAVNGAFLCDRGQFGHAYVMDPDRPREVRVRGEAADWEGALGLAGGTLLSIARSHGPASVAFVASPRAWVETHESLAALASGPLQGARVSHFDDPARECRAIASLAALTAAQALPLDQGDIADCDVLLVAGTSLVDEAPLAALAARQLVRRSGRLFVLNAGERYFSDVAEVVPTHPARLAAKLQAIARQMKQGEPSENGGVASVAAALGRAERPGVLLGGDLLDGPAIAAGAELARSLKSTSRNVRLGYLFPGPNGFGAAVRANGAALAGILSDLEAGKLKAMVLVESDVAEWSAAARKALWSLELLITLDHLPGPACEAAHVVLPSTVTYESNGIYVNRAGRAQAFAPALVPGRSVVEMIERENFPRTPRQVPPEGGALPAWWVLEHLRERTVGQPAARSLHHLRDALARSSHFWRPIRDVTAGDTGVVLDLASLAVEPPPVPAFEERPGGLALFRADRTLGSEVLSRRSAPMEKMAGPPLALVSTADAERGESGRIALEIGGREVEVAVRALATMPEGVLIVPRDLECPELVAQGAVIRLARAAPEARR